MIPDLLELPQQNLHWKIIFCTRESPQRRFVHVSVNYCIAFGPPYLTSKCLQLSLPPFLTTQDFHRKLEIEKSDNRLSDSKALQLLEEVKTQSRIAQQLRETAAK